MVSISEGSLNQDMNYIKFPKNKKLSMTLACMNLEKSGSYKESWSVVGKCDVSAYNLRAGFGGMLG